MKSKRLFFVFSLVHSMRTFQIVIWSFSWQILSFGILHYSYSDPVSCYWLSIPWYNLSHQCLIVFLLMEFCLLTSHLQWTSSIVFSFLLHPHWLNSPMLSFDLIYLICSIYPCMILTFSVFVSHLSQGRSWAHPELCVFFRSYLRMLLDIRWFQKVKGECIYYFSCHLTFDLSEINPNY